MINGTISGLGNTSSDVATVAGDAVINIQGTFTGQIVVEKSRDNLSWPKAAPVPLVLPSNTAPVLTVNIPLAAFERVRLRCDKFTSGSVTWSIQPPGTVAPLVASSNGIMLPAAATKYTRAALARVRARTGRFRPVIMGDSTTMGGGAGTGGTGQLNAAYPNSIPALLAARLNLYVPAINASIMADHGVAGAGVAYGTYDTRVVLGVGWAPVAVAGFGGNWFGYTAGSATTMAFTPVEAFDTIEIYSLHNGGTGTFGCNVDGGSNIGTITSAGANAQIKTTFTCTKGTHTINLTANNNGNFDLLGVIAYDSTTSAVDVVGAGWYGAIAGQFADVAFYGGLAAFPVIAPDLTIISLTINTSNGLENYPKWLSNMQLLITAAQATGDCWLMVGPPSSSAQATNGTLAMYVAGLKQLAAVNNCGLLDLSTRWIDYATQNAVAPYFDTLHPTAVGANDEVQMILEALLRA